MIRPIVAEFLSEVLPGAQNVSDTKLSAMDDSFRNIFNSIQEQRGTLEDRAAGNATQRGVDEDAASQPENENPNGRNDYTVRESAPGREGSSTSGGADRPSDDDGDDVTISERSRSDETDDIADDTGQGDATAETETDWREEFLNLLKELAEQDPGALQDLFRLIDKVATMAGQKAFELTEGDLAAFRNLMNDRSEITLHDLVKALGFSKEQIEQVATIAALDTKLSGKVDRAALNNLLTKLMSMNPNQTRVSGGENLSGEDALGKNTPHSDNRIAGVHTAPGKTIASLARQQNAPHVDPAATKAAPAAEAPNPAGPEIARLAAQPAPVRHNGAPVIDINIVNHNNKSQTVLPNGVKTGYTTRELFERTVIDQIVRKARLSVRPNGSSNMMIQLEPPNLGKVNLRISVQLNLVRAVMMVERPEIQGIIENNLDSLKSSLNNQGLKVDQIIVTTPDAALQNRSEGMDRGVGQDAQGRNGSGGPGGGMDGGGAGTDIEPAPSLVAIHHGVLDIVA